MKVSYPTEDQIRARAYQIYQAHNGQPGHDVDDWLQAEYELMQLPVRKIAELNWRAPKKRGASKLAVVSLVHLAMMLGSEAMPHLPK